MAFAYAEQVKGSAWSGRRLTALFLAIAVNVGFLVAISAGLRFDNPFVTPEPIQLVEVVDTVQSEPMVAPEPVVKRLNEALLKVLAMPDVRGKLDAQQAIVIGNSPAQFGAEIARELARMRKAAAAAKIELN